MPDDVAADGTDAARHRTEGTRTVGEPEAEHERVMAANLPTACERHVSLRWNPGDRRRTAPAGSALDRSVKLALA